MDDLDYDKLDPGIREVVRGLRAEGFNTTDSGDGSKFGTMEGALPYPMVVATCKIYEFFLKADRFNAVLKKIDKDRNWYVEATYSPTDGTCTLLGTAPDEAEMPESEN